MTYHFLPSNDEESYAKVDRTVHINKRELIWSSGCDFINRSKSQAEKNKTNRKKHSNTCCVLVTKPATNTLVTNTTVVSNDILLTNNAVVTNDIVLTNNAVVMNDAVITNNNEMETSKDEPDGNTDDTDSDEHKCADSDVTNTEKEPKTISEEEDEMLRKRFKNRGRRNAICETHVEERTGFPRVLKHYIHLKTFQKCGLG
jgi:hypothetical protein